MLNNVFNKILFVTTAWKEEDKSTHLKSVCVWEGGGGE